MKKTYITPAVLMVRVATGCQICIGSPSQTSPTSGLEDIEKVEEGAPDTFGRRRRSVWDEDEEEDF